MTLLTEIRQSPRSVGLEGGGATVGGTAALEISTLAPWVEWMRFCPVCDSEQRFVAGWICDLGLVGCCSTCGDERILPFTRMNSEVA
jgi:hypothetical protein